MKRIVVTDATGARSGWFDADKAEQFHEATRWDGHNHVSVNTGTQWDHEELWRTAQGRWVLGTHSQRQGTAESMTFIDEADARLWLVANDEDSAMDRLFPEIQHEDRRPGRPAIGEPVNVRLGELLTRVDAYAALTGANRAEAIRSLVEVGLKAEGH